jgi:hypothetical protein
MNVHGERLKYIANHYGPRMSENSEENLRNAIAYLADLERQLSEAKNKAEHYESEWSKCSTFANREIGNLRAELAKAQASVPRWIPCSERMPDLRELVWCHVLNPMDEEHPSRLRWNGTCWINKWGAEIIDTVTHWQPLPETAKRNEA